MNSVAEKTDSVLFEPLSWWYDGDPDYKCIFIEQKATHFLARAYYIWLEHIYQLILKRKNRYNFLTTGELGGKRM